MSIEAKTISAPPGVDIGLTIVFSATGDDEMRIRRMFDIINDDGDISKSVEHVLNIAVDAVNLIEKHQSKLY